MYTIPGKPFSLRIAFPFTEKVILRVSIVDDGGRELQKFEKQMTDDQYLKYSMFFGMATNFLDNLLRPRR